MTKERILSRAVEAVQIPNGDKVAIAAGARVHLTQTLGGSFTVMTDLGLARIDGRDADALGEKAPLTLDPRPSTDTDGPPDPEAIWHQLRQVFDPEIPVNIVDLGLVYSMEVEKSGEGHQVNVALTLTAPGCGMGPAIAEDARGKIMLVPGVTAAQVNLVWDPPWNQSMISEEGRMKLGLL